MHIKRAAFNRGFEEARRPANPLPSSPDHCDYGAAEHNHPPKYPPPPPPPSPPSNPVARSGDKRKKSNNFRENFAVYSARSRGETLCAHTDPAGEAALETPSRVKTVVVSWLNIFARCVRTPRGRAQGCFAHQYKPTPSRLHQDSIAHPHAGFTLVDAGYACACTRRKRQCGRACTYACVRASARGASRRGWRGETVTGTWWWWLRVPKRGCARRCRVSGWLQGGCHRCVSVAGRLPGNRQ